MRQDVDATSAGGGVVLNPGLGRHPRYHGSYPCKIATHVGEKWTITLPFLGRSSMGLPAQIIGLQDTGYTREGHRAEIVVFDYDRVRANATILNPAGQNEGIVPVFVNGVSVVENERRTGTLAGHVLLRTGGDGS